MSKEQKKYLKKLKLNKIKILLYQILFANYMCVRLKATFGDKPTITTVQRDMAMTIRAVKDK